MVKPRRVILLFVATLVAAVALIAFRETPLPKVPQSIRCAEMAHRRDIGAIRIPDNASKNEVRRLLGDPQNVDQDGEVWLWLMDWKGYERSGLPRTWLTMSQNSGGHDGLWIGFDTNGRVRTPLWSLSAATPPANGAPVAQAAVTVSNRGDRLALAGWYSKILTWMKEPSLYQQSTNKAVEQYRFLWLRSFHKPIAVRVWKNSTGMMLRCVRLSGPESFTIERDDSFALAADQWDGFLKLLDQAVFWEAKTGEGVVGRDGAMWILEGQVADRYHVVGHHSPSPDDGRHLENFVECCRYLLKLSKEQIPRNEDY